MSRERACRVMGALSRLQSQRAPEGGPRGRVFSVFSYETILVLDCFGASPGVVCCLFYTWQPLVTVEVGDWYHIEIDPHVANDAVIAKQRWQAVFGVSPTEATKPV